MCVDYASMWTMLPMLLLWPGLCCLCAALWLLLWPGLCGGSMCLLMLAPMIHLWATIRGISFPVTSALIPRMVLLWHGESVPLLPWTSP
jgi:hypothetical protein